ncbi:PucR family transcriptional regulator [Streptomyces longispororuber]|uniref:PucR family transcriptional regulator n=1 Tax=Streptomyces longispororuber TaxID=68230 RepID=UPI00210A5CBB|nr:helix-turn-helix domain-containing protein [Streptomyces longispororuber]MCQ4211714.1 helix-turn-helix domain-containing protein [Streptomyces longispororuber]
MGEQALRASAASSRRAPLQIAGRQIGPYLRARVPELSRAVVGRLRTELPVYAGLPAEAMSGDITEIVQHNLRLCADVLEHRRPATESELTEQRDSASQRAEEGVPLDAILTAYHMGSAMCWREITADAEPHELPAVQEAIDRVLTLLQQLTAAVSAAYLETRLLIDSQEQDGRRALMAALLSGEEPGGRGAPRPAPYYAAFTLAVDLHPDEKAAGPGAAIAARRKIRRLRAAIDRGGHEPALTALDSEGGTVLLPVTEPPPWSELCRVVEQASRSAAVAITAAASVVGTAALPEAVRRNAEVVELVRRTGRPPGLYRLADVLLDYQLSRPGAALDELANLLAPLGPKPGLLRTLEVYLACDLDRRAAAAALFIHPNTVDYRIRRITQLTGLSPSSTSDLHQINAALVARRSRHPVSGPDRSP